MSLGPVQVTARVAASGAAIVVRGAAAQVGTATRVATAPLERARANE